MNEWKDESMNGNEESVKMNVLNGSIRLGGGVLSMYFLVALVWLLVSALLVGIVQ